MKYELNKKIEKFVPGDSPGGSSSDYLGLQKYFKLNSQILEVSVLISLLSNRLGVEMEIYILFIFFSEPKKMIYVSFVVGCKRLESAVS